MFTDAHLENISAYLGDDWREHCAKKAKYYDEDDATFEEPSLKTFIDMVLSIRPREIPMLGVSALGFITASWIDDSGDRLCLECRRDDNICWIVSAKTDGVEERASGDTSVKRLIEVLAPYDVSRWFLVYTRRMTSDDFSSFLRKDMRHGRLS